MNRLRKYILLAAVPALLFQVCIVAAQNVVIHLQALNPLDEPQEKEIRRYLPPGLKTNDIVSLGDLALSYDSARSEYYVGKAIRLGPKETKEFKFTVRDIWVIPDEALMRIREKATSLAGSLKGTDRERTGRDLGDGIVRTVDAVARNQANNRVGIVDADTHIKAFVEAGDVLETVRKDMDRLQRLAGVGESARVAASAAPAVARPAGEPRPAQVPSAAAEGKKHGTAMIVICVVVIAAAIVALAVLVMGGRQSREGRPED